jgi:hypothetical protein
MTPANILVHGTSVSGWGFSGTPVTLTTPRSWTRRTLDSASIHKVLSRVDKAPVEIDLEGIFDESGSVRGSNDTIGVRHEIFLIAAEHLARVSGDKWCVEVSTFDMNSDMELPRTRLNRQGLRAAEASLLSEIPGSSSNLGPALRASEKSADPDRPRLLCIATDMELFDPDPAAVADLITHNSATKTLLLVLSNTVPSHLVGRDFEAVQILPATPPTVMAEAIVRAAQSVVATVHPRGGTQK